MNGARFVLCCVILCLLLNSSSKLVKALPFKADTTEESKRNGSTAQIVKRTINNPRSLLLEPINDLKVNYTNKELIVRYSPFDKEENEVESRDKGGYGDYGGGYGGGHGGDYGGGYDGGGGYGGGKKGRKKGGVMQRIGKFMLMIPIVMQLLQLPAAIASVKAKLLQSLIVAKVALFMLLLRVILQSKEKEKTVIVKVPPKELHEHYYHPWEDPEDQKPGWLGKGPEWME